MIAWPMFGIAVMVLGAQVSPKLIYLLFLGVVVFGLYGMSLKCPMCRNPIEKSSWGFWTPWVPRHCRHCGHDLEQRGDI
jgi:hypothetical protein